MIGQLRGIVLIKRPPHLVLDVQGVGYEIEAPMSTFYRLPATGAEMHLFTHLAVRDDAHLLFGFATEAERRLFRALLKVNGVGARTALTILSGMETGMLVQCIRTSDVQRLVRLPGIGRKTAERLVVEMRDRLADWEAAGNAEGAAAAGAPGATPANAADEAVSALIALGYKPQEASRHVQSVVQDGMGSEDIIREALKASIR
ncbi:MAG: Holliday junction branch migration protein RuvA [Gammaproteobacteria bacterium]|nr:Holliday junction branch migration protein RuvA [Gammaproteobacteria bacterium]